MKSTANVASAAALILGLLLKGEMVVPQYEAELC
jgi:hypothetical protein